MNSIMEATQSKVFYVIASEVSWVNKKGETVTMVSYFREHNTMVLQFNSMVGKPEEAKQYEFKTEAHRDKRKYFGNSKKVSVIKIESHHKK